MGTPVGVGEGCESVWSKREFDKGIEDVVAAAVERDTEMFGTFEVKRMTYLAASR